jgi:hypothetical protein
MKMIDNGGGRRASFAVALLLAAVGAAGSAHAATPFNALEGSWAGGGRAVFEGGKSERLRCTANYRSSKSGRHLNLAIRCASASTNTDLRASLTSRGAGLSGSWEERTFNVGGGASGKATGSSMRLRFSGGASGTLSVSVSRASQAVSISTQGTALRGISLSLSRRR